MSACDVGRERIHALLDEGPGAPLPDGLRAHLATCPGCRELHEELTSVQAALRGRPRARMPDDALEAVWDRTVRSRSRLFDGRRAAAAAILVTGVSLSTLWLLRSNPVPQGPTEAEIARAEAEADLVFSYAARALAATREAATREVVGSKISPAVRGAAPSDFRRR